MCKDVSAHTHRVHSCQCMITAHDYGSVSPSSSGQVHTHRGGYQRVKRSSHTGEERTSMHSHRPHATSQPSLFSHTHILIDDVFPCSSTRRLAPLNCSTQQTAPQVPPTHLVRCYAAARHLQDLGCSTVKPASRRKLCSRESNSPCPRGKSLKSESPPQPMTSACSASAWGAGVGLSSAVSWACCAMPGW